MTGFTFKGSNSKFYLLSSIGIKSLIDRICSSESALFPLRVDPSFNACRKSHSKTKLTHGGIPIYLKNAVSFLSESKLHDVTCFSRDIDSMFCSLEEVY